MSNPRQALLATLLVVALSAITACGGKSPTGPTRGRIRQLGARAGASARRPRPRRAAPPRSPARSSPTVPSPAGTSLTGLAGVTVTIVGTSVSVMSDDHGRFELSNVVTGAEAQVEGRITGVSEPARTIEVLGSTIPARRYLRCAGQRPHRGGRGFLDRQHPHRRHAEVRGWTAPSSSRPGALPPGRPLDAPPPRRYAEREHERAPIVTISLNGEPHELEAPLSVSALLERLGIDPRRVAVEVNLEVVRRAKYEATTIGPGDQVEIVNFVGGG